MSRFLCFFVAVWCFCLLVAEGAPAAYKASFGVYQQNFKGSERPISVFVVDDGTFRVEFVRKTFWTIGRMYYRGELVGRDSGGTGSVVHWDGKPVGTVHQDGGVSEKLISVDLTVDGKTIPLYSDGKEVESEGAMFEGERMVLVKRSIIGPFRHEASFTFSKSASEVQVKNDYEALEAVTAERFKGYRYVFMHMMPLDMTEWMSVEGDGQVISGTTTGLDSKLQQVLWTRAVRGFASYSPERKVGMCYFYPEYYPGMSHFVFRGGKDTKFRSILFDREEYPAGEKLSWSMTLEPFSAGAEGWLKAAEGMMKGN